MLENGAQRRKLFPQSVISGQVIPGTTISSYHERPVEKNNQAVFLYNFTDFRMLN
jgi:hypothetical protein